MLAMIASEWSACLLPSSGSHSSTPASGATPGDTMPAGVSLLAEGGSAAYALVVPRGEYTVARRMSPPPRA